MTASLYWFRNDLRLTDNAALTAACAASDELVLCYIRSRDETSATSWGFPRWAAQRRKFRDQALRGLAHAVAQRGGALHVLDGNPQERLPALARQFGPARVFCEHIAAPEEVAEVAALRAAGVAVHDLWQSSLLDPDDLPFGIRELPEVFTPFRVAVERAGVTPRQPGAAPEKLPQATGAAVSLGPDSAASDQASREPVSSATEEIPFEGSECSALSHVHRYFSSTAPQTYKQTRNGLTGIGYSTKLSPWLAVGALSPRTVFQCLKTHEARFGANDSTYWIWFELLWRDFFRFWTLKHGVRLFRARGLGQQPPAHDPTAFSRWCAGETGHAFVDAGLRDLAATGYLSNRMRQVTASYLVHDLACDWRAGAAWFESRLIDYDVYSNHGNWLYIAGRGADPRQGRRFNPDKQAADYDAGGSYRAQWAG